jgi:hypothetical protein
MYQDFVSFLLGLNRIVSQLKILNKNNSIRNCRMTLEKDDFYRLAREMRSIASKAMDFGTSGIGGGVDGESNSATFYKVVKYIGTDFIKSDDNSWGVDLGSGSGVASMAFFNGGMGLNMIGIECNEQRFAYSLTLQSRLLAPPYGEKFSDIAKKSQFFEGDGIKCLTELLGATDPIVHLKVLYWFREGWDPDDIEAVVGYFNNLVINLEWIICDMNIEKLHYHGFKGRIVSSSHFSGPMSKSSNSRTLYVHHVQMQSTSARKTRRTAHAVNEKEKRIIEFFGASLNDSNSRVTAALDLIRIRSNISKKDRAASLKRKRLTELAPLAPATPPKIKVKKPRRSPRLLTDIVEEAHPQRVRCTNAIKVRAPSLQRKRSIELSPEPKQPEIKITESRRSPRIKNLEDKGMSKRQLLKEQQQVKREAKRLQTERNLLEVFKLIEKFREYRDNSP